MCGALAYVRFGPIADIRRFVQSPHRRLRTAGEEWADGAALCSGCPFFRHLSVSPSGCSSAAGAAGTMHARNRRRFAAIKV